jgi:hypothetical protein
MREQTKLGQHQKFGTTGDTRFVFPVEAARLGCALRTNETITKGREREMISLRNKIISASTAVALLCMTSGLPQAMAATTNSISIVPTITSVGFVGGHLVATGTATAVVNGVTTIVPFSTPVHITAQPAQAGTCPVLDLMLGPIDLNLLGLEVQTSQICLTITATQGGGLLGDLLCSLGNLLNQGLTLKQVLAGRGTQTTPGLTTAQVNQLLGDLTQLLNQAVANLNNARLTQLLPQGTCSILHLELGPLNLTLLGLNVVLDNCHNHAITVDIIGHTTGPAGGLLGQLLCGLLGGGGINLGATLQDILNALLGLLNGL